MSAAPASSWLSTLVVALALLAGPSERALGQTVATPVLPTLQTPDLHRAEQLARRGQTHYELGEYQEAIESFRKAYELSGHAALLFNLAQAHRLDGNCLRAVEVYRHFLRLAPASPARPQATAHLEDLRSKCPAAAPSSPVPVATTPLPSAPIVQGVVQAPPARTPGWGNRQRWSFVTLGGGALLGATAGTLYVRNGRRYDEWRAEDIWLRTHDGPRGGQSWLQLQETNNQRWTSVRNQDRVALAIALTGGALLATGLWLFFTRE